jgi:hypothetical protein
VSLSQNTTVPGNPPARASRLELSAPGGTLDAKAVYDDFEWEHHAVLGCDMYVRTDFPADDLLHRTVFVDTIVLPSDWRPAP